LLIFSVIILLDMKGITRREFISSLIIAGLLSIPIFNLIGHILKRKGIVPVRAMFWKRV